MVRGSDPIGYVGDLRQPRSIISSITVGAIWHSRSTARTSPVHRRWTVRVRHRSREPRALGPYSTKCRAGSSTSDRRPRPPRVRSSNQRLRARRQDRVSRTSPAARARIPSIPNTRLGRLATQGASSTLADAPLTVSAGRSRGNRDLVILAGLNPYTSLSFRVVGREHWSEGNGSSSRSSTAA